MSMYSVACLLFELCCIGLCIVVVIFGGEMLESLKPPICYVCLTLCLDCPCLS